MNSYPSIETVFVRDKATNLLEFGKVREPEIECVKDWTISEKIDGTNIRVTYRRCALYDAAHNDVSEPTLTIKGRTDKAELPPGLEEAVVAAMPSPERAVEYFTEYRGKELPPDWSVTFYGEGYGPGIQKGGVYANEKRFRVFDLKLGEHMWTDDEEMRRVCGELGIPTAPHLGWLNYIPTTREELHSLLPCGSAVAQEDKGQEFVQPEGIVAKPARVLLNKRGERVMWKLTFREFKDEQPKKRVFESYPGGRAEVRYV